MITELTEQEAEKLADLFIAEQEYWKRSMGAQCKNAIDAGFESGGYFYGCRIEDQLNYNSLLQLLDADDDTVLLPVTCKNIGTGVWAEVAHNHKQVSDVAVHGAQHVYTQRAKLKNKLAEIEAATTIEELELITW